MVYVTRAILRRVQVVLLFTHPGLLLVMLTVTRVLLVLLTQGAYLRSICYRPSLTVPKWFRVSIIQCSINLN